MARPPRRPRQEPVLAALTSPTRTRRTPAPTLAEPLSVPPPNKHRKG